ncbi:esterase FE4-like [Belonocnema kinseyi]|uniref:esterase FE4-like n=1 Tax=Belonocnema kinseyi TaxID=2817044 RepID=UPI00143D0720|nr:esterase FE4-like [Belonocnema kinseyi]
MWISKLLFCSAFLVWASAEEVLLDIPQGTLKGLKTTTITGGKPYYSFKGIPYAKPNVGPNKFRQPEKADPWQGVLDATKHRSTCVFYCMIRDGLFGEEDCLYLNIYTPAINKDARKASMVFIHPGGFEAGSGDDDIFGPDLIIDEDVILVTMNFRLGALGFISTGDSNAPGNAGMKDQVMALQWIKENIQNFGGCPNRVTLVGQSSGAASVQYHMLSPMSKGLFKNAIMQSGSALSGWAISCNPKERAFKLGEVLGVKTTDSAELIKKLMEFSAKELVDASKVVAEGLNAMNGHTHAFVPVVEPQVGQEVFLPADPWELLKSAKFAEVPVLIGVTLEETAVFAPMMLAHAGVMNDYFEGFVPSELNITDAAKLKEIGDSLRKFYLDGKALSTETAAEYIKMTSDIMFNEGILMSAQIMASKSKQPVYEYLFSYYSPIGIMKNLMKQQEGVTHGDEFVYEFYSNAFKHKAEPGTPFEKMTRTFIKLWTNFAKYRNPTNKLDDDITENWEPLGPEGNYMNINLPLKMEKGLFKERLSFWANLYKDVLGEYASLFS